MPYFLELSLVMMGYFVEDFVHHNFVKERTSDFWEMNFHHLLTLTLFGGMILQNFIRVGIVIAWLHNAADILTSLSRVLSQTQFKSAAVVSFISCILVWIYLRNIAMPYVTYKTIVSVKYPKELSNFQAAPDILKFCLVCLCLMHLYWLTLFIRMIVDAVKSGDTDDKQRAPIKKAKAKCS